MGRMAVGGAAPAGRIVLALLACLTLAGCSDEPSEGEMRTVVESATRRKLEASRVPFGRFDVFRKQGCVTTKTGTPPLTVNGKGRFTRKNSSLLFEDLGAQPR